MPLALVCTCFCRGAFASMGDHDIPTPEGESNELAGYHMMGRLFAVGCMRGLLDATRSPWR